MNWTGIIFLAPYIINFSCLYGRKIKWANSIYRWVVVCALAIVAVIMLQSNHDVPKFIVVGLIGPLLFSLLDLGARLISFKLHDRDMYLWLRYSPDFENSVYSNEREIRWSDRILSVILLFSIILMPFMLMVLSKKLTF